MKKIIYRKLDELKPYKNNPRINDQAVGAVAESIVEFGFNNPILIDSNDEIVAGHTRHKAAEQLGIKEVPTIKIEDLNEEQIKAFRLADNKTAELAFWDMDKLLQEAGDIEDIDMSKFGFNELIENIDQIEDDAFDFEEEIAAEKEPTSKPGDLYELGEHLLLVGDATKENDLQRLQEIGGVIDMVITDPPYGVDYEETQSSMNELTGQTSKRPTQISNDALEAGEFLTFLTKAFTNMNKVMKAGAPFYVWHADMKDHIFRQALNNAGLELRQKLIWVKNSLVLSRQDYNWRHEPCFYGWKDGAAHYFIEDYTNTTVQEYTPDIKKLTKEQLVEYIKQLTEELDYKTTIIHEDRPTRSDLHPTMKPVRLFAHYIHNSSKIGDTVLDPFGGSGTTMIACERLGRKARLIEYDPIYADTIIKRYEAETGKKAKKIE